MMNKEWIIYACGIHALAFAIFHAYFWKLFRWRTGLDQISKPNRAILQIANVQLIYVFIFVAFVCFLFPTEVLSSSLGKVFLIGNAGFWIIRFIQQFVFLRINHWMNHSLTILFLIGFILFLLPLF